MKNTEKQMKVKDQHIGAKREAGTEIGIRPQNYKEIVR